MNMKTDNMFRRVLSSAACAAIVCGSLLNASCKEDETSGYEGGAFLYLENAKLNTSMKAFVEEYSEAGFTAEAIISNSVSELVSYDIRSNRDWRIEVENPETDSWVKIYPNEGKLDGRVKFLCEDNDNLEERSANVYFYYADGTLAEPMLTIRQKSNKEHIDLYVDGKAASRASATTAQAEYAVTVRANVPYYYKSETEWPEEWFRLTETDRDTYILNIDKFDSQDGKREGYITFYGAGEHSDIVAQLRVMQSAFNADNSVVVTVEELLASLGEDRVVTENYSVEAIVNQRYRRRQYRSQYSRGRGCEPEGSLPEPHGPEHSLEGRHEGQGMAPGLHRHAVAGGRRRSGGRPHIRSGRGRRSAHAHRACIGRGGRQVLQYARHVEERRVGIPLRYVLSRRREPDVGQQLQ